MEDDQASISTRLAEGEPVAAERHLLLAMSSVLHGAPTRDLSSLRIDGEPVSHETLVDWLNKVYVLVYDTAFDVIAAGFAIFPAPQLYRLLAFVDAVGSPPGLLRACTSGLEHVVLLLDDGRSTGTLRAATRARSSLA